MSYSVLALLGGIVLLGAVLVLAYIAKRDRMREIRDRIRTLPTLPARHDLPLAVAALAERLGARPDQPSNHVHFHQTGVMLSRPDSTPMPFSAEQHMGSTDEAFLWRARMGPGRVLQVADYLVHGKGGLRVWLGMVLELMRDVDSAPILLGERLRYLAELPLNPDAILYNHHLRWTVPDEQTLMVAVGEGDTRAEVRFELGLEGMIEQVSTPARPYKTSSGYRMLPWRGRFADYAVYEGRLIPHRAEVGWEMETGNFIYWRGRIDRWEVGKPRL